MSSSESERTSHGRHLTGFSTSNGLAAATSHARATVQKVVSGGQTGVDRAALDVALELGLARGGWCPKGRKAEDGRIPPQYPLKETPAEGSGLQPGDLIVGFRDRPVVDTRTLQRLIAHTTSGDKRTTGLHLGPGPWDSHPERRGAA